MDHWRGRRRPAPSDCAKSVGVAGRYHIHVICWRYGAYLAGGYRGCAALFGGGERRRRFGNKQLDNQLDCWWKAKGGVDERPVTVMNRDELQPLLVLGDDIWKVEENGCVVVRRRCDCHR